MGATDRGGGHGSRLEPGSPPAPDQHRAPRHRVEGPAWLLGGALAAVLMTWPLVQRLTSVVPQSTADPLAQAWHIAWGGYGLRTSLTSLYDANAYWPDGPSLAFADAMLGYAPLALVGSGPGAALVRYNALFLFSYALLFAAAGLLGRELGLRVPAALVVAVGAAFSPTRIMQANHLNVLSVGGVALTLFLLLSGYRRQRRWQVVAGWLTAVWQLSIGFATGIWFAYLLALLAAVAGVAWLWRGRPAVPRRMVLPTVGGVAVLAVAAGLLVLPYLAVIEAYPEAQSRQISEVTFFAPPPRALLAAAPESRVWGAPTAGVRAGLDWPSEQSVFPGLTLVVLAMLGLRWRGLPRSARVGLFALGGTALLLSFGPRLADGILYDAFYRYAPGWANLRTPGRLSFLWSLVLALLAGMGAQRIVDVAGPRATRRARLGTAAVLGLAALVALEGSMRLPLRPVAAPPVPLSTLPGPQLHLPSDFYLDPLYMLWSTDGFPLIANGAGSFDPPVLQELRSLQGFPDAVSVRAMRDRGIRTVLLHRRTAPGTPWEDALDRPVAGLGIARRELGAAVVFDLGSRR